MSKLNLLTNALEKSQELLQKQLTAYHDFKLDVMGLVIKAEADPDPERWLGELEDRLLQFIKEASFQEVITIYAYAKKEVGRYT